MTQLDRHAALARAQALVRSGQLAQAEQICQALLRGNSVDVQAIMLLGSIAFQQGALDRAEAYCQRCLNLQPRDHKHACSLGKIRLHMGKLKEAVDAFDRSLKLAPSFGPALAGKAEALNQLGEIDQARATVERLVKTRSETPDVALIYATLMQQAGRHEEAIEVASRHLGDAAMEPFVRVRLGLLIGKSHEQLGQYEQAFEAYRRANEHRAAAGQFDAERYVASVDHLIEFFNESRMRSLSRSTIRTQTPVFIAGMPRSGTTLIEQIISAHPQGHGAGEVIALDRLIGASVRQSEPPTPFPDLLAGFKPDDLDRMGKSYLHEVGLRVRGKTRIVDKYLRNHHFLGLIELLFPRSEGTAGEGMFGARVIHCRRDPMDTCWSCYTSALSPVMHGYCSSLEHLGTYYRQYQRLMAHWPTVLNLPILDVQYEALVADPEPMIRKIIEFCDLPWDERCLHFHQSKRAAKTLSYDQVRRPIYDKSIGRAKHFAAHLGPLRAAIEG